MSTTTVDSIIETMGGADAVARRLGVGTEAVRKWRQSRSIPSRHWPSIIAATTLVTTTYRASERGKAQALNDFLIFGTTAIASFLAGYLEEKLGWAAINWIGLTLVIIALAGVAWLRAGRREATA